MYSENFKNERIQQFVNGQSSNKSESTLSKQFTNLSVNDISMELQVFWNSKDPDGIITSFQNIKECCNNPDQLLSTESFYPTILPILESILNHSSEYPEEFPVECIMIESLTILDSISQTISLQEDILIKIVKDLYYIVYEYDFQPDYPLLYELSFSILTAFNHRGGIYEFIVADYFRLIYGFKPFFIYVSDNAIFPVQHAAIIFLTSFTNLLSIEHSKNASDISEVIQQSNIDDSDRILAIKWLFDNAPDSFETFDPDIFLPFIHSILNEQGDQQIEMKKKSALSCISTIIRKKQEIIEFDYSVVFRNIVTSGNQSEVSEIFLSSSLELIIEMAKLGMEGLEFLASNIDLKAFLSGVFNDGHSIQTQKYGVSLINTIITEDKQTREFFSDVIFDEAIIAPIISLLYVDEDISLIKDIFECFSKIIDDSNDCDELSQQFYDIFDHNGGWEIVHDMMFNSNYTDVHNSATLFYYLKNQEDIMLLPQDDFNL